MAFSNRLPFHLLLILLSNNFYTNVANTEETSALGAEYLQNAIRDIQQKNSDYMASFVTNTRKFITPTVRHLEPRRSVYSSLNAENRRSDTIYQAPEVTTNTRVPSLSLTKGELMAIYQSALANGNTVKLNGLSEDGQQPLQAAVHEIQEPYDQTALADSLPSSSNHQHSGYYYYYYPLKSFFDELQNQVPKDDYTKLDTSLKTALHSHHIHQHNVKIEPIKAMMEMSTKSKALEPLFMAISGFIGMAVMFVFSMVFLPRFKPKPKKSREMRTYGNTYDQIYSLGAALSEMIENYECKTCNTHSRSSKMLNVHNNSFINS